MKIQFQLRGQVPVQKNYKRIPKPLHKEIKEYVKHLQNRDWIVPSESNYSLPVVVVYKKDGALRLCCDYRALNAKMYPGQQPLSNI